MKISNNKKGSIFLIINDDKIRVALMNNVSRIMS